MDIYFSKGDNMKFIKSKSRIEELKTSIFYFNNIIQINIKDKMSYDIFMNILKQKLAEEDIKYLNINQLSNKTIEGIFIIIKGINESYNVLQNNEYYFVSKNTICLDKIIQISLLCKSNHYFEITEKIKFLQSGSKYRKFESDKNREVFSRKEALFIAKELLNDLNNIYEINNMIDLKNLQFNPEENNNELSLKNIKK